MNIELKSKRVSDILEKSKGKRIAVIGDVMLDRYVYGEVTRISPEAPVQVVDVINNEYKLGGAANVANNINSLQNEAILIGVTGNDREREIYLDIMKELGLTTEGIFKDEERPTTLKTRVIAHSQHIIRIDQEMKKNISRKMENNIIEYLNERMQDLESIILQDYNKGLLTKHFINRIITSAKAAGKNVYVDPKFDNFFEYKNVTVFKPNRKEIQDVMGVRIDGEETAYEVGKKLINTIECEWLIITRGEKGMMLFDKEQNNIIFYNIPTRARNVADVSGAGDTVISTIAACLSGGADIKEAIIIANQAAGLVCEEVGIVPVKKNALINSFEQNK
jgi:rfaE bifunctional protein kinase chain/domain